MLPSKEDRFVSLMVKNTTVKINMPIAINGFQW